jgi:hypothetical protein
MIIGAASCLTGLTALLDSLAYALVVVSGLVVFCLSARELTAGTPWLHTAATLGVAIGVAFVYDRTGLASLLPDPLQPELSRLAVYGIAGALLLVAAIVSIRGLLRARGRGALALSGLAATGVGLALWLGAYLYGWMAPEYPGFSGRDIGEPFAAAVLTLYPLLILAAAAVRAVAGRLSRKTGGANEAEPSPG